MVRYKQSDNAWKRPLDKRTGIWVDSNVMAPLQSRLHIQVDVQDNSSVTFSVTLLVTLSVTF